MERMLEHVNWNHRFMHHNEETCAGFNSWCFVWMCRDWCQPWSRETDPLHVYEVLISLYKNRHVDTIKMLLLLLNSPGTLPV